MAGWREERAGGTSMCILGKAGVCLDGSWNACGGGGRILVGLSDG